jgi:hypothetical protein
VENEKITLAQAMAGHHAHSNTSQPGAVVFARISDRSGARRGLRQGWGSDTRSQLLLFLLRDSSRFYSLRLFPSAVTPCALIPFDSSALPL